jgi:hypothetical protein
LSEPRRRSMKAAIFGIALVTVFGVTAGAAPRVLAASSSGLLVQSDAPSGFGKLHTSVYTTWVKKMKVPTTTKGMGKSDMTCDALTGSKKDGWVRGMIQAFDSPGLLSDFELCESVFSATAGAKTAYTVAVAELTKAAAKTKGMGPMQAPTIGDASHGVFGIQGNYVNAELVLRHGTAVVTILYLGSGQFSGKAFVATVKRANSGIMPR